MLRNILQVSMSASQPATIQSKRKSPVKTPTSEVKPRTPPTIHYTVPAVIEWEKNDWQWHRVANNGIELPTMA